MHYDNAVISVLVCVPLTAYLLPYPPTSRTYTYFPPNLILLWFPAAIHFCATCFSSYAERRLLQLSSVISLPLTVYWIVVSCCANVSSHSLNDASQTGGGGIGLQWSRRQSAALSQVMMAFVVCCSSACCHYFSASANFAQHSKNLMCEGCGWEFHLHPSLLFTFVLFSDWADDDRAGDCCEPACRGMGGDPGVGDHPPSLVWPRLDGDEEPGQQLLPQLCHASALHRSRLPEQVSTLFFFSFLTAPVHLSLASGVLIIPPSVVKNIVDPYSRQWKHYCCDEHDDNVFITCHKDLQTNSF